jgi:hypothetical protein
MIVIGNTIISDEIKEEFFTCDLNKCKGACCIEGDAGAPLEEDELEQLEEVYEAVEPYLSDAAKSVIEEKGFYEIDEDGDFVTPTINGRECVYAIYDKKGILKCGIEHAYREGKTDFRKPVSCHLYPIRVDQYEHYEALNYHRWYICSPACNLGQSLKMPIYRFAKDALIRKYGQEWYDALEYAATNDHQSQ